MTERALSCEIAVVGAGPAGMAAACTAAESGRRVVVIDDSPSLGGQIWRGEQSRRSVPKAQRWIERFRRGGATLLDRTSVIAVPHRGTLLAERDGASSLELRYQRLILATGARELFLPFPGWTLPGVVGAGGLQSLAKNGWPVAGKRVVIAGSGPLLFAVSNALRDFRATVVCIAEQAHLRQVLGFGTGLWRRPAKLWQGMQMALRTLGVPYRCGSWPIRVESAKAETEAARHPSNANGVLRVTLTDAERTWVEECDYLACGFGLVPNVELPLAAGCKLDQAGFVSADAFQQSTAADVYCAGEPTGIGGVDCALVEGQIAGYAAAGATARAQALFEQRAGWHRFRSSLAAGFALREQLKSLATDETLLCRCEDVMLSQVRCYASWREAKLQTRCGMGPCQGRVCGAAAKVLLGWGMQSVRPPLLPARVQSLISNFSKERQP